MARRDNNSCNCQQWTTRKLIEELESKANLTNFGTYSRDKPVTFACHEEAGDWIREQTRLYRESWMQPLIDELKVRLLD